MRLYDFFVWGYYILCGDIINNKIKYMSIDLKQTWTITKAINPLISAVFTKIIQSSLDAPISIERGLVQQATRTASQLYSTATGNCKIIESTICPNARQSSQPQIKTSDLIKIIECRERDQHLTEDDYKKLKSILSDKYVIFTQETLQKNT